MAFTAKDVSALRERTGCGMMDCKKALTESNGDMDKAVEILREKGLASMAKKSGRIAAEGVVVASVEGNAGAVVEVNSETDFVAKNADFVAFANACCKAAIKYNPADVDALMKCSDDNGSTLETRLQELALVIKENMKVRRFVRMEGTLVSYVHGGGKIGVLVKFDTDLGDKPEFTEYAKNIAMQIAAINPIYLNKEDVPAEEVAKEKEILIAQIKGDPATANKPDAVIEKMVVGRLNKKFYQDACLVEQPYVKDGNVTVGRYTADTAKALGGKIAISAFVRYERGEGIEKREDNFADEVAKMVK